MGSARSTPDTTLAISPDGRRTRIPLGFQLLCVLYPWSVLPRKLEECLQGTPVFGE
jgi:hypothetical protein